MMPASVVCFVKDIILKYFRTQQREKHPAEKRRNGENSLDLTAVV